MVNGKGKVMIYLDEDSLEIRFPELHQNAGGKNKFQTNTSFA